MFYQQQVLDKVTRICTADSNITAVCLALPSSGGGEYEVDVLVYLFTCLFMVCYSGFSHHSLCINWRYLQRSKMSVTQLNDWYKLI
jgi:hypothetical protein